MTRSLKLPPLSHIQTWECDGCGVECSRIRIKGQVPKWCADCRAKGRRWSSRNCLRCSQPFLPTYEPQAYCTRACYSETLRKRKRRPKPVPRVRCVKPVPFVAETRDCAWCGSTFTARRQDHVMCQRRCKVKAKKVRRRGREVEASGTYTWSEVTRVYLSLGGQCAYCHLPAPNFEPDHVIPLSRGGSNSITNIVPSCPLCNSDKRDLSLSEWAADRERRGLEPRSLDVRIRHLTSALLAA